MLEQHCLAVTGGPRQLGDPRQYIPSSKNFGFT